MSKSYASSPGRFWGSGSVNVNSPINEPIGSPDHAAALLARINARARERKEGLKNVISPPPSDGAKNRQITKSDKSVKEKNVLTEKKCSGVIFSNSSNSRSKDQRSLDLDSSDDKTHLNNLNEFNNSEVCMTILPKKESREKTVIEFVVDATEDSESLIKKIKGKLNTEVSENEEQQPKNDENDIHSNKKKKKKRKDITPENDTVDSFIGEEKVECIANLELQPLKKKKKKRTHSERENENLNNTENKFENNLIKLESNEIDVNKLEAQISSKRDENDKEKEVQKKKNSTGFDEEKVECSADLKLQPLKKKKKKRTHSEHENENLSSTENKIENNLMKLESNEIDVNKLEAQINSKRDKNEETQKEVQKKKNSTGFEDFFCISDEKECFANVESSKNEVLEDHINKDQEEKLVVKSELGEKDCTGKDSSEKEAMIQINYINSSSGTEQLKSQELSKGDTAKAVQTSESLLKNDEGKKKKRKKKKKNKESSEKDGNSIEGFTFMGEVQTVRKGKIQRVLPFWLSHPLVIERDLLQGTASIDSISELDEKLVHKLKEQKITNFFPIQKSVIPQILAGASPIAARYRPRDICVSAPTGSGKTLAFVLPIVQALSGRTVPRIRALVLLPVQELAIQVYKVFLTYAQHMGLHVGIAVGLKSFAKEQTTMIRSDASGYHSLVDILVATPGKLSDHLQLTKGIDLTHLRYLVLDEADRMLAADGGEWVDRIEKAVSGKLNQGQDLVGSFPPPGLTLPLPTLPLQHLLFSATLSHDPEQLQHLTLYRPKLFTVTAHHGKSQTKEKLYEELVGVYTRPAELREQFTVVEGTIKPLILHHLAVTNNWRRTLVFTNTTEATHKLSTLLQILAKDLIIKEFSSVHKRERTQIISQFMAGKIDMLISTDAMARGLDVPDIEQVVSYDVTSVSTYVHRIGRTARAGKPGTALSLVTKDDIGDYKNVLYQGGGVAEEISVPMEKLEVYEDSYKEALAKMKETLLHKKQERRNKVEASKGNQRDRLNNKRGMRKGIKRLQNGKAARFPSKI